jgi:hypothetical protein
MNQQNRRYVCLAFLLGTAFLGVLNAQTFTYTTFDVPEAAQNSLSVQNINTAGVIAGYLTDTSGNLEGWIRDTDGSITLLVDPLDTNTPSATAATGLGNNGVVTGYFYDTSAELYYGYFYKDGQYVTYSVPDQPAGTDTALGGINNLKNFCGFILQPPYTNYQDFVSFNGVVTVFSPFGTTNTNCFTLNSSNTAVGFDIDSAGLAHGWMRTASGTITAIDVPVASTVPGPAPCISGNAGGTVVDGINDKGYISGHYWDKHYNEHGFVRNPNGRFLRLDVPGAYQTAGGGINNAGVVVGHWATDSSCDDSGFIATPTK